MLYEVFGGSVKKSETPTSTSVDGFVYEVIGLIQRLFFVAVAREEQPAYARLDALLFNAESEITIKHLKQKDARRERQIPKKAPRTGNPAKIPITRGANAVSLL